MDNILDFQKNITPIYASLYVHNVTKANFLNCIPSIVLFLSFSSASSNYRLYVWLHAHTKETDGKTQSKV